MIFSPALARQVARAAKWQTRRLVQRDRSHGTIKPCRYKPGRLYAVQPGRGQAGICNVLVSDVRREPLNAISEVDAKAEGFATIAEFAGYWLRLHEKTWPGTETVDCPHCDEEHVIWNGHMWVECPHCELGRLERDIVPDSDETLARFRARHGHRDVWVITFELSQQRFLAAGSPLAPDGKARLLSGRTVRPRPPRVEVPLTDDEERGYTTSPARALRGEPEVIDSGWVDALAERARERHEMFRRHQQLAAQRDRERLAAEERIVLARQAAALHEVDLSGEFGQLRRMQEQGRPVTAVLAKLGSIERRAHKEAA